MKKYGVLLFFIIVLILIPNTLYAQVQPTYRALLVGNANYLGTKPLNGPYNDLSKMKETLTYNYFGQDNQSFKSVKLEFDLNKNQMIESIRQEFKDVKPGDVSYFYYSGHGLLNPFTGLPSLVGVDGLGLSVDDLELELREIPGTVIVILDSCHSGGFINKGWEMESIGPAEDIKLETSLSEEDIKKYNDSIIDIFSQKQSRSYLVGDKYKVITASSKFESSVEFSYSDGWGWGGEFTRAFVSGIGYNNKFLADTNNDKKISLDEIYDYSKKNVMYSNVQVYPMNDNYILASKYGANNPKNLILWDSYEDVPLNKVWKVEFNKDLDETSWKNKIYILDSFKNLFPTLLTKSLDGKIISVSPKREYNYNSDYTLIVEDDIISKSGSKLNNKILMSFITEKNSFDYETLSLNIVQDGHFNGRPYPTVKEAFNNFFAYPSWEYFYSTDNNDVVEFKGRALKGNVPGIVTMQFTVDIYEGSFKVEYSAFNDDPMTYYEFEGLLDKIYSTYLNDKDEVDIENIFSNEESLILNGKAYKD